MSTFSKRHPVEWEMDATEIMFRLKDEYPEFTADDFYRLCRAISMPADLIKKFAGAMFKRYQAAGYIRKNGQFKLSARNGSSPLPVWAGIPKEAPITDSKTSENSGR